MVEAVIWTDDSYLFNVIDIIINNCVDTDGGFRSIVETASKQKFIVFDLNISIKEPTVWVMLLGGFL